MFPSQRQLRLRVRVPRDGPGGVRGPGGAVQDPLGRQEGGRHTRTGETQ